MTYKPEPEKCFACGKPIRKAEPYMVQTIDGQKPFVGPECAKKVVDFGDFGYDPPKGGPRLYHMMAQPKPRFGEEAIAKAEKGA